MWIGRTLVAGASPAVAWRSVVGDRGRAETATGHGFDSRRLEITHRAEFCEPQSLEALERFPNARHSLGDRVPQHLGTRAPVPRRHGIARLDRRTDLHVTADVTVIRAAHITSLRVAVRELEEVR